MPKTVPLARKNQISKRQDTRRIDIVLVGGDWRKVYFGRRFSGLDLTQGESRGQMKRPHHRLAGLRGLFGEYDDSDSDLKECKDAS